MKNWLIYLFLIFAGFGCGVRGDPIPPGAPTELGHGYPSYKDPRNRLTPVPLPSDEDIEAEEADDDESNEGDKNKKDKEKTP